MRLKSCIKGYVACGIAPKLIGSNKRLECPDGPRKTQDAGNDKTCFCSLLEEYLSIIPRMVKAIEPNSMPCIQRCARKHRSFYTVSEDMAIYTHDWITNNDSRRHDVFFQRK